MSFTVKKIENKIAFSSQINIYLHKEDCQNGTLDLQYFKIIQKTTTHYKNNRYVGIKW